METSNQRFLKWMQEYYHFEFMDLPNDFKDKEIEKVLFNNAQYITKEDVLNFDGCIKCGQCCRNQGCKDLDLETNLCKRHDNPIHELCRTYPWTGEDLGIAPLTLNCNFTISIFVHFFNEYFAKIIWENKKKV